jgi:hypothetical protein
VLDPIAVPTSETIKSTLSFFFSFSFSKRCKWNCRWGALCLYLLFSILLLFPLFIDLWGTDERLDGRLSARRPAVGRRLEGP